MGKFRLMLISIISFIGILSGCVSVAQSGKSPTEMVHLAETNFNYVSVDGEIEYTFMVKPNASTGAIYVYPDVVLEGINFCSKSLTFVCVMNNPAVIFAFPLHWTPYKLQWHYRGYKFQVLKIRREAKLLGRTYKDLVVIETTGFRLVNRENPHLEKSPYTWISFYSPEAGLIGFKSYKDGEIFNPLVLSQSETGFGAQAQ